MQPIIAVNGTVLQNAHDTSNLSTPKVFEINKENWPIFTTRPDTIFGVTFMVVSAQHPNLMELVTKEQQKEVEKFWDNWVETADSRNYEMGDR